MTAFRQTASALVLFLLAAAAPVGAQQPRGRPETPTTRARGLTLEARQAFNEGRFAVAAELLERAWALEPSPSLLYNIARAHQQAGAKRRAIDAYERYLLSQPGAADEGAIRTSIQQLRDELAAEAKLTERAESEEARADREAASRLEERRRAEARRPLNAWPWVTLGVGLAGLGTGVTFGFLSSGAHAAAIAEPDAFAAERSQRTARDFAVVANVSYVVGGALALAGAVWGTFELVSARADVRVVFGPTSVRVAVRF